MYIAVTAAARVYQVGFRESLDLNRNMFPFFFYAFAGFLTD